MKNQKLLTPHEAEIDRLLQVMAALIERLGGEVVLSREEIESFFDIPVVSRVISPDYVRFRLIYPDESTPDSKNVDLPILPEETP